MTGILQFETRHGLVSIEVDEDAAGGAAAQFAPTGLVAKGGSPRFEDAMASLKAYAGGIADLVEGFDIRPEEVSVEVGLKFAGSAGFIIAKAGAETSMKVALKWKPRRA